MTQQEKKDLNLFIKNHKHELLKSPKVIDWEKLHSELFISSIEKLFYNLINSLPQVKEAGGFVNWSGVKFVERYYYPESSTAIVVPEGLEELGDWAFFGCNNLTSITLPKSLKRIDDYVFENCNKLKVMTYLGTKADWAKIEIPDNLLDVKNIAVKCLDGDTSYFNFSKKEFHHV